MPVYYPDILDEEAAPYAFTYNEKDVILYALGIGLGTDPMNETELAFVYERRLKVVPTVATVLQAGARTQSGTALAQKPGHRVSQLDFARVLHGEQKIELHRPLPAMGSFTASGRTVGAFDKGRDKGALIVNETVWRDDSGQKVVTITSSIFARGDGGFGGPSEGAPEPHPTPARPPDRSLDFPTRADQALLYRLNGDRNPLHCDPEVARIAGFPRPILHGLCTYGITCRAVLEAITDFDPEPIASHQVRFSAPVFPGDVITVDLWRDGDVISFEARVKSRAVTVIKNGKSVLRSKVR